MNIRVMSYTAMKAVLFTMMRDYSKHFKLLRF